ncbi:hypothetical protein [Ichthyobacterium seriolicida]|uniref:Uncharacterized protein n=1 Tax=Ichthyobacterium seriolicida TaxID=242600 RepID=A0A1J1E266_9FLAO|nr:hypothetical protein [Ichthyobacterium seriolicida]BAV94132.1 hypothetical protein JBKA6_0119 [Ichthyobacterium seriolicida]
MLNDDLGFIKRDESNQGRLKVIIGILSILLFSAIGFALYEWNDSVEVQRFLNEQKKDLERELSDIADSYQVVLSDKDSLNTLLHSERDSVLKLVNSVKKMKATITSLKRYKFQVEVLRREKKELFRLADSLDRANEVLIAQRDNAEKKLKEEIDKGEVLKNENKKLKNNVEIAKTLEARSIKSEAIIVNESGALESTDYAFRADKVRVCFTLSKNNIISKGYKNIYVVVNTPDDKLLGVSVHGNREFKDVYGDQRAYSATKKVYYDNENLDVCVYVDSTKGDIISGTYLVGMFVEGKFIGEETMELK